MKKKQVAEESPYAKLSIQEIETRIEGSATDLIVLLIYLKTSGRYKENKAYERTTFYDYCWDRFGVNRSTFMKMQKAYVKHPEETKKFGPGKVIDALDRCGPIRGAKALNEMAQVEASGKNLDSAKKEKIIQKYENPTIKKTYIDWRAMYENEAASHEKTKKDMEETVSKLKELEEQNEKLKAAVVFKDNALSEAKAKIKSLEAQVANLQKKIKEQEGAVVVMPDEVGVAVV